MSLKSSIINFWTQFDAICNFLKPVGDLFIRFWLAKSFFQSGLMKLMNWNTTVMLFQFEYHVPLLSPKIAAPLAAIIELSMSIFLLLGLGERFPAFILFIFNLVASLSYPFLWTPAGYMVLKDHICWGLLLMIMFLHGPGKLSLDRVILWWYKNKS